MKGRKTKAHKPLSKRVAKIERELNQKEIKYTLQSHIAGSVIRPDYNGLQVQLGAIPVQGDGAQERIGDEYHINNIHFEWDAIAAASTYCNLRIIIVQYKHDVASTASSDTLEGLGQATAPFCTMNIQERDDYVVLYDKRFVMQNFASDFKSRWIVGTVYPKLPVRLDPNSTTVNAGQVMAYFMSDYDTASANRPQLLGFVKVRFHD